MRTRCNNCGQESKSMAPGNACHTCCAGIMETMQMDTESMKEWMKAQSDDTKQLYAINWRIPHTLFNVSCRFFDSGQIQGIDWFSIYKERDLGTWSHGGRVCA